MQSEAYHLFFVLFIAINTLSVLGIVILSRFRSYFKNTSIFFFGALTIGVVLPVIITSLAVTNFKTINGIIVIIACYVLYSVSKNRNKLSNNLPYSLIERKATLIFFAELNAFVLAVFVFYYYLYSHNRNVFFGMPAADLYFYSRVSGNLLNYHAETNAFAFMNTGYPAPYHYFDIWLNACVSLFNKNTLTSLIFITLPMQAGVCYFGFKGVLSDIITSNKWLLLVVTLSGFIISGVYISGLYDTNFIMGTSNVFSRNILNYQKLFPMFLFLLWTVYFLKNNKPELFFISLGIICICYISALIAIFAFCACFFLYHFFKRTKQTTYSPFIAIGVILIIICFYFLLSDKSESRLSQARDIGSFFSVSKLKTGFNILVKTSLQFIGLYLYLAVVFFLNFKKNISLLKTYKQQATIVFLLYSLALISWVLFCHVNDSVQLFSNLAVPLLNITAVLFIAYNLKHSVAIKHYTILLILILVLFASVKFTLSEIKPSVTFDEKTLTEFKDKIYPSLSNKRIVYFKAGKYLNTVFTKNDNFAIGAPHFLLIDNFEYISLSVFDYQKSNDKGAAENDLNTLKSSYFYKYVNEKNERKSISQYQTDFVVDHKIQLVVISEGIVLPQGIKALIKDSIRDHIANETYFLLKQ